jgi:hypothetical protein
MENTINLMTLLGGLSVPLLKGLTEISKNIKNKKETGEHTRKGTPPIPRAGLVEKTDRTLNNGGRIYEQINL